MNAVQQADPTGSDGHEPVTPVKDRLTTTLFLAALFHGIVILGVTFATHSDDKRPTPTLEVLLLTGEDTDAADNQDAQYLAQRSQRGHGVTDERVRPANLASSAVAAQQTGSPEGNSTEYQEEVEGRRSTAVLSSRSERSEVEYRRGQDAPVSAQTPLALSPTPPSPIATRATDEALRLRGRLADGDYAIIPNTRESQLAPYIDAWRRKVERLGTLNFPRSAQGKAGVGNPVLEVTIRADGALGEAVIRRSSGRKDIDQAALSILRLASPFDPFPAEVRRRYEELRFAYEWQFLEGGGSAKEAGR